MARRSDHTRDELSELLVDASTRIITEEGLGGLTARKIASRVGYSSGSVYNVFSDLDDLIAHVNTRTMQALSLELKKIRSTGEVLTDVKAVLHVYMDFQEKNPRLWAANIEHAMRQDFDQPDCYTDALDSVIDSVAMVISPALGNKSDLEVKFAVRVLWASLLGISAVPDSAKFLIKGSTNRKLLAEDLVEHYVLGLISKSGTATPKRSK